MRCLEQISRRCGSSKVSFWSCSLVATAATASCVQPCSVMLMSRSKQIACPTRGLTGSMFTRAISSERHRGAISAFSKMPKRGAHVVFGHLALVVRFRACAFDRASEPEGSYSGLMVCEAECARCSRPISFVSFLADYCSQEGPGEFGKIENPESKIKNQKVCFSGFQIRM